jgi:glycosyltransferase involved in cell wall biosynthesis
MKSLLELYKSHDGKVSDKWLLYLTEYDRLFKPYRELPITLLEIGVQNGGSLEIWSQYFSNGIRFVGCDINPDCQKLTYDDSRIAVIVGDATTSETQQKIHHQSATFDLIIEDGSHTAGDIVKAFARYFPALKETGLFVAEDLHCSYWQEYQGGIFHPYSSMNFFKHLADIINHEHWGIDRERTQLLSGFKNQYQIDLDDDLLSQIHSVEFINSICVIRKRNDAENHLGSRFIAGSTELVVGGIDQLRGTRSTSFLQSLNEWSCLEKSPLESHSELTQTILDQELEIAELSKQLGDELVAKELEIAELSKQLGDELVAKELEIAELSKQLGDELVAKEMKTVQLSNHLVAIQNSRSWRYTSALRKIANQVRISINMYRRVKQVATQVGGYLNLMRKLISVIRKEGFAGLQNRISGQFIEHKSTVVFGSQTLDRNDYQSWIKLYDNIDNEVIQKIHEEINLFECRPTISVIMPVYNPPIKYLEEAIKSVQNQIYGDWELCIADDASTDKAIRPFLESLAKKESRIKVVYREKNGHISAASNSALELATGEYVALLDNDDLLPIHAFFHVAKAILANPDVALIYSDEDKINANGFRYDPYFKCELNYELLLGQNMISHLGVYRRDLLSQINGFRVGFEGSQDYDLALRVLEKINPWQVVHIPKILYHWRALKGSTALDANEKSYASEASRRAIHEHLQRTGRGGKVSPSPDVPSLCRVRYPLPEKLPFVSIVIPTRDKADLLKNCLDSIFSNTTYENYEVIIVDNGSIEAATKELFDLQPKGKVRIIRDDLPFNYSRLNNLAFDQSRGDVICLMNNDIEVITPDWLEEMVSFVMQNDIGCVGARLWYPDERLQHGGVILGLGGVANHAHKFIRKGNPGYFGRAVLTQSYSAVTGACLVVRRSVWIEVDGLDESLAVAFNDIDFCLKVRQLGYRNIWTPYAEMIHHESLSRGPEDNPEKVARFNREVSKMKERWGDELLKDPAYSPNLTSEQEDFSFAWPPRIRI